MVLEKFKSWFNKLYVGYLDVTMSINKNKHLF